MSATLAENMKSTTISFVQTWTGPSWLDAATPNLALRAPECEHTVLPSSLNFPVRNNEEWASFFSRIAPLITNSTMTVHDYLAVPEERRTVCRTSIQASTPVGEYRNEYIWFLWLTEDGTKIRKIVEFFDSKAGSELLGKLRDGGFVKGH